MMISATMAPGGVHYLPNIYDNIRHNGAWWCSLPSEHISLQPSRERVK